MRRWVTISVLGGLLVASVACESDSSKAPFRPADVQARAPAADAAADLRMKATDPAIVEPKDGVKVGSRTPTLVWQNAEGKYKDLTFSYEVELYDGDELRGAYTVAEGSEQTTLTLDVLNYDRVYQWRVRAKYLDVYTAFTGSAEFRTPPPPWVPGEPFGPERRISAGDALAIIRNYHDVSGADLGSRSTRESRIAFLFSAVALVHFGHPTFNALGGDRDWCVKDAGSGRPPSDDVLVSCSSRDAWDLVASAGADGYAFHLDYIGRLPSDQNVYPPPLSSLPR